MEYKKILIAIDDSSYSLRAAKLGFDLAHQVRASVGLVYVIDKGNEIANPDMGLTEEQAHDQLRAAAESVMDQYVDMYNGQEEVFRFTPEGEPQKEIIKIAEAWATDLIVMGTHGGGVFNHMFSGSRAEYILAHAKIPVLIAPPKMP